jgi:protein gp37
MSSIEWTDRPWTCVRGCSRVSEGCRSCYAERIAVRFSGPGKPYEGFADVPRRHSQTGTATCGVRGHWTGRVELIPEKLDEPLHWRKPRRVFVNSMSDLFHEALPDEAIDRVFAVMALSVHTFQILTKRADRMRQYMESRSRSAEYWKAAVPRGWSLNSYHGIRLVPFPLPNVWLGVSVENQEQADIRVPLLLQTPAAVRFVSYEPALGPVYMPGVSDCRCRGKDEFAHKHYADLPNRCARCGCSGYTNLDWLIVGGESGPGARPFQLAWARSVRDQCRDAGVAFFYKQGGHAHRCIHSAKGGHLECIPEDLRVREFPR